MKQYGYNLDARHQAIIFKNGTPASLNTTHNPTTPGLLIGTSEWGWIEEDTARRICAALQCFRKFSTEEIERLADSYCGSDNDA